MTLNTFVARPIFPWMPSLGRIFAKLPAGYLLLCWCMAGLHVLNDEYTCQWQIPMYINWCDNSAVAANVLKAVSERLLPFRWAGGEFQVRGAAWANDLWSCSPGSSSPPFSSLSAHHYIVVDLSVDCWAWEWDEFDGRIKTRSRKHRRWTKLVKSHIVIRIPELVLLLAFCCGLIQCRFISS